MLIHKKSRKILLNLREPERVTTLMPSAKSLVVRGKTLVAVPHKLDEVRVLRNIGIDAPSPIESYYEWPGRYQPFAHQRITSSFLTVNPRAFCLNGMGCISGDATVRVSRKGKSYETTLRELHRKFHSLGDPDSWKVRSLMDGRFGMNRLQDTLYKGEQPTLHITLADGKSFRCTPDHELAQSDGSWIAAGDLRVGGHLVTNGTLTVTCPKCAVPRELRHPPRYPSRPCVQCRYRSQSVRMRGAANHSWVGGKWVDPDGYVRMLAHGHHRADRKGYVYEHILVAEGLVGHPITVDYHVHHINENKSDNRPENLQVLTATEHHRSHDHRVKLDGSISAKGGVVVVLPKQSEVVSIEGGGVVDVYDLCMESPHNNFVVNGVVVHNSGKTMSVLWAFDYLRKAGLVKRMLVISPLSTLERAWGDEIFRHFPDMKFAVLHGTRENRHKLLAEDFDVYIINHDGIKSKQTLELLCKREELDIVVIDEVASMRNPATERFKAINRLVNGDKKAGVPPKEWVWGLTGTPTPNSPTDAYGQAKLVVPHRVPLYMGKFRDSVMRQNGPYKWVPRDDATAIVKEAMQPSVRFAREDCIDLPPTTFVTRQTELTPEQQKAFDDMLRKLKAEHDGGQITAVNEAVKLSKLLQICCGCVIGTTGEVVIPAGPRVELVREIIEEAEAKVLVFVPFTAPLLSLAEELRKDFTVEVVLGETSKAKRDQIFSDFQKSANPRVLVANPGTLQHGLTLTAASAIIWFAPIHSLEAWEQANARIVRPGQKCNTLIVSVQATAMEEKIYTRLKNKGKAQGTLLELLNEATKKRT